MSEAHPLILALVSYLEHDALPAIVLDTDYNILAANAAYRRQFGRDDQAPLGEKCHKVSHHYAVPCDQAGEHCPLRKSLDSKMPERVQPCIRLSTFARSGAPRWFQAWNL